MKHGASVHSYAMTYRIGQHLHHPDIKMYTADQGYSFAHSNHFNRPHVVFSNQRYWHQCLSHNDGPQVPLSDEQAQNPLVIKLYHLDQPDMRTMDFGNIAKHISMLVLVLFALQPDGEECTMESERTILLHRLGDERQVNTHLKR